MKILVKNYGGEKLNILVKVRDIKALKRIRSMVDRTNDEVAKAAISKGDFLKAISPNEITRAEADIVVRDLGKI